VVPLDMALNSFDDQYRGCSQDMFRALPKLNRTEQQQNQKFADVWAKAAAKLRTKTPARSLLSPPQAIAVMIYTMRDVYQEFNDAVRVAGSSSREYRDNFHFKTLHFLLTDALDTLRDASRRKVYRGVRGVRFQARRGDTVRFGHFTSTSLNESVADGFGQNTTFYVNTSLGVPVWDYSDKPEEWEVLIPPFEAFRVTDVTEIGGKLQIWLDSTTSFSKYECEWLQGDTTGTTWGE
ncbi:NRT2 ribosyltransferase, partial [Pomatostomus ruficeps]|nr:NRT2 ribosyltransferase [Pomatostomus ruficeps]